jgi:hypothetical protein
MVSGPERPPPRGCSGPRPPAHPGPTPDGAEASGRLLPGPSRRLLIRLARDPDHQQRGPASLGRRRRTSQGTSQRPTVVPHGLRGDEAVALVGVEPFSRFQPSCPCPASVIYRGCALNPIDPDPADEGAGGGGHGIGLGRPGAGPAGAARHRPCRPSVPFHWDLGSLRCDPPQVPSRLSSRRGRRQQHIGPSGDSEGHRALTDASGGPGRPEHPTGRGCLLAAKTSSGSSAPSGSPGGLVELAGQPGRWLWGCA